MSMTDLEQIEYIVSARGYCCPTSSCNNCAIYKMYKKCIGGIPENGIIYAKQYLRKLKLESILNEKI